MTEDDARRITFERVGDDLTIWLHNKVIGEAKFAAGCYDVALHDGTAVSVQSWPYNNDTYYIVAANLREAIFIAKEKLTWGMTPTSAASS